MKRCPTCNRSFADHSLSFCTEDGTPLVNEIAPDSDPEATIVGAAAGTKADQGKTPPYQPPVQLAPLPDVRQRRVWPWVVGIVVLLLIGVGGIAIALAIVVPRMMSEENSRTNENTNTRSVNSNAGNNQNANSAVANENQNGNANTNANSAQGTDPPSDENAVLADLTALEKEWTEANFSADRKKLMRILADDYVGTIEGNIQGKADYLRDLTPDKSIKSYEFRDLKLSLRGDRATLKGRMHLEREGDSEALVEFTDKFVWRDARWQAVSSEVALVKT
jgi:hypothetical protein